MVELKLFLATNIWNLGIRTYWYNFPKLTHPRKCKNILTKVEIMKLPINYRLKTLKSQTYHSNQTPNKQQTSKFLRLNSFVVLYLVESCVPLSLKGVTFSVTAVNLPASQFKDNWINREKRSSSTVYILSPFLAFQRAFWSPYDLFFIGGTRSCPCWKIASLNQHTDNLNWISTRRLIAGKPSSSCLSELSPDWKETDSSFLTQFAVID